MKTKHIYIHEIISCLLLVAYSGILVVINRVSENQLNQRPCAFVLTAIFVVLVAVDVILRSKAKASDPREKQSRIKTAIVMVGIAASLLFSGIASNIEMAWDMKLFIEMALITVPYAICTAWELSRRKANGEN